MDIDMNKAFIYNKTLKTFKTLKTSFKPFFISLLLLILPASIACATNITITGAGATFPYPLYAQWAQLYKKATGVKINYQAIGSGGGIKQIQAKTVDFGASDKPLSAESLKSSNLIQFPTVIGGIVPVVNLRGIHSGQLKLSGSVLAHIYLGKIKKWNDPAIASLNKDLKLPDQFITVVHRSDGSGTTYLFTDYLSKVSENWKTKVGSDVAVDWPAGIGGKGNEGVAAYVQRINGAIGYVEYAYTQQNRLKIILLENKEGEFVAPSLETFKRAAEDADWKQSSDFVVSLTNTPGAKSWPIIGATFILMQSTQTQPNQGKEVLKFFKWAFDNGQEAAVKLDYVPLPDNVIKLLEDTWRNEIKDAAGKEIWP